MLGKKRTDSDNSQKCDTSSHQAAGIAEPEISAVDAP